MRKITIVEKRPYDFKGKDGEQVTGNTYGGFLEDGEIINFSSKMNYDVVFATSYDSEQAIEVDIIISIFDGKVKYRDNASRG